MPRVFAGCGVACAGVLRAIGPAQCDGNLSISRRWSSAARAKSCGVQGTGRRRRRARSRGRSCSRCPP